MSGSASLGLEQQLLDHTLGITPMATLARVYVALCQADPAPTEEMRGIEVSGGGYARVAASFTRAGNVASNSATIEFPAAAGSWGTVGYFEIWTAATGGSRQYWGPLVDPSDSTGQAINVATGDILRFSAGTLAVQALDVSLPTDGPWLPLSGGTLSGLVKSYDPADDWLAAEIGWAAAISTNIYSLSPSGQAAGTFGTTSLSGATLGANPCPIGVQAYAFNNWATDTYHPTVWAGYLEARSYPGIYNWTCGYTIGAEVEIVNLMGIDSPPCTPYLLPDPVNLGIVLASGGGAQEYDPPLPTRPASVGMWVCNNGGRFQTGLMFHATGMVGTDGTAATSGTGQAIGMAKGHAIQWFKPDGTHGPKIYSQQVTNPPVDLAFSDGLASFNDAALPLLGVQSGNPASGNTAMLVLTNGSGGIRYDRVSIGAPDSGGAGFRVLRVPN